MNLYWPQAAYDLKHKSYIPPNSLLIAQKSLSPHRHNVLMTTGLVLCCLCVLCCRYRVLFARRPVFDQYLSCVCCMSVTWCEELRERWESCRTEEWYAHRKSASFILNSFWELVSITTVAAFVTSLHEVPSHCCFQSYVPSGPAFCFSIADVLIRRYSVRTTVLPPATAHISMFDIPSSTIAGLMLAVYILLLNCSTIVSCGVPWCFSRCACLFL